MAILVSLAATIAHSAPREDQAVGQAVVTVLGWAENVCRAAVLCALVLSVLLLLVIAMRRRWALLRDAAMALVVLAGTGSVVGRIAGADWLPIDDDLWSRWGFPEYRLAAAIAILTVVGPELVRPVRAVLAGLVVAAGVGQLAIGSALPSGVLGAVALGLGAATLVRLVFGSAAGVPPSAEVRDLMIEVGVELDDLRPLARQEIGSAVYAGHDHSGRPVRVRILGRDAQDTQRLARRWHLLAYRDLRRSAPVGRLEQVEHEALATLMASRAGVCVPEVVIAALGSGGDAGLVTRQADLDPLELVPGAQVNDETLVQLWREVARMRGAGISHGRLNASQVIVDHEGRPVIVGLAAATMGAPQLALDIDVAELLVSTTVLVGPDRALKAAVGGAGVNAVKGALPYLQRAALTPHTRERARSHEVALRELRSAAAAAAGTDPVEIAPMARIRPRNVLLTAAVLFSVYALVAQLADFGFAAVADNLRHAQPAWVVVALVVSTFGLVPEAISLRGTVATPLPLLPCVVFKSGLKVVSLTVPGPAGTVAATVRFVQRMGGTATEAVASGAVDDVAEKVVQILLVVLMLPFVREGLSHVHLDVGDPDYRLVAAIVATIVASGLVVGLVPAVRKRVVPPLREGLRIVEVVLRDRRKRLELFGGNALGELTFALGLGAVCHAYGVGLTIAELLVINIGASVLAGLIPAPGGVGVAEATLTAALIAFGVDESTAFAIAITTRLCTHYLPPLWGYPSLLWLRRQGFV
ncbi:lysylphosphatidylglycerol synthase domain-containing protein [Micromonospora sp. R77]|uniref:lysylphosphatidylglycerol synthase transmembrane domain-containing protein n=1 Tax=Micromonospora sp. R77 TaxID=2925836 RepID=UPI001F608315|nr:lysylphosphatidylglycerol synthase transmembrane domain-containing protein [Micromonospora sp. R77]MCI4066317.1 lysylphosphatidylglycerol synthase domain-containing protein [Micromonospora sp. R77]